MNTLNCRCHYHLGSNSKDGREYYNTTTCSLWTTTEKFDVEPKGFQLLTDLLHTRVMDLRMLHHGGNPMIPPSPAMYHIGEPTSSIQDYGWLLMEYFCSWENTFIATQTQNSQNSKILLNLIRNSLMPAGLQ